MKIAHACGVALEGELGYVPGVEGEEAERYPGTVSYTTLAEVKGLVARTGGDFLAVSIGTVHDRMKDKPKFDWNRLKESNAALGIPLVIHGGTGLADDQFRKLITLGVAKINYYTALSELSRDGIRAAAKSGARGWTALLADVRAAVSAEVERHMRVCGGCRSRRRGADLGPRVNVEHVVVYNAPGLDGERLRAVMAEGQCQLSAIPGVREVQVGSVADKSARYHHCWLIRFASAAVIDSYNQQHPAHVAFADRLFRPAAVDHRIADYLVAGVEPGAIVFPISGAAATADTNSTLAREKI